MPDFPGAKLSGAKLSGAKLSYHQCENLNSDKNSYYVGIDTSVPSSSTIPLADPPAVVVIEATGLQRIWNVIVFAVATLYIVVIFVSVFTSTTPASKKLCTGCKSRLGNRV